MSIFIDSFAPSRDFEDHLRQLLHGCSQVGSLFGCECMLPLVTFLLSMKSTDTEVGVWARYCRRRLDLLSKTMKGAKVPTKLELDRLRVRVPFHMFRTLMILFFSLRVRWSS